MSEKANNPFKFWEELKRRKVVRVITVYAAASFVILELVDIVSPSLGLPPWTLNLVLVLLCVGFIISIIFSWVYDITPEGIQKTKAATQVRSDEKQITSKGWKISTFISVLVIIAFIVFYILGNIKQSSDISNLEKSIAVLPFENFSSGVNESHLGDAIANEISTQLAKIQNFEVRSFTSCLQYKGTTKPSMPQIGMELNANFIIEGSIELQNEDVSIHVQVIQAENDNHIWADEFKGKWSDIFTIRANISKAVASKLKTILSPDEIESIEKTPTTNLEAYDYYLLGTHSRNQRTPEALLKSIYFFEKAIELDPEFLRAYTELAHVYGNLAFYGNLRPGDAYPPALDLAFQALELDSLFAEAYNLIGTVNLFYNWDFNRAEEYFERAAELNPNNPEIYKSYAEMLFYSGQFTEALEMDLHALALDPVSPSLQGFYGLHLYYAHQKDSAISYLSNKALLNPFNGYYNLFLGVLYLNEKDYTKAIEEFKKALNYSGSSYFLMTNLGLAFSKSGRLYETQALLDTLEARAESEYVPYTMRAVLLAELGRDEEALNYLMKGVEEKEEYLLYFRHIDKISFSNLRPDPRYIDIMAPLWMDK